MADYDDETIRESGLTEREEQLPIWVQDRLKELRRTSTESSKKYDELFDSQKETKVLYGDVYNNPRYLPDSSFDRIHYQISDDETFRGEWVQVARKIDPETKSPYVELTSASSICAVPQAINVLRLFPVRNGQIFKPEADTGE